MRLRQEVADNDSVGKHFHSDCANENYCIVLSLGNGKQFKLKCDVGVLKIIYENFAPGNCANAVRADTIIKEYKSLSYESGQIVATVQDNADALDVLLELYAAGWHIEIDGNEGDTYYFKSAYKVMLGKIKSNYPGAEIWCFTLCRPAGDGFEYMGGYSEAIRDCANDFNCKVIELYNQPRRYTTFDGLHPDANGMKVIAEVVLSQSV